MVHLRCAQLRPLLLKFKGKATFLMKSPMSSSLGIPLNLLRISIHIWFTDFISTHYTVLLKTHFTLVCCSSPAWVHQAQLNNWLLGIQASKHFFKNSNKVKLSEFYNIKIEPTAFSSDMSLKSSSAHNLSKICSSQSFPSIYPIGKSHAWCTMYCKLLWPAHCSCCVWPDAISFVTDASPIICMLPKMVDQEQITTIKATPMIWKSTHFSTLKCTWPPIPCETFMSI